MGPRKAQRFQGCRDGCSGLPDNQPGKGSACAKLRSVGRHLASRKATGPSSWGKGCLGRFGRQSRRRPTRNRAACMADWGRSPPAPRSAGGGVGRPSFCTGHSALCCSRLCPNRAYAAVSGRRGGPGRAESSRAVHSVTTTPKDGTGRPPEPGTVLMKWRTPGCRVARPAAGDWTHRSLELARGICVCKLCCESFLWRTLRPPQGAALQGCGSASMVAPMEFPSHGLPKVQ